MTQPLDQSPFPDDASPYAKLTPPGIPGHDVQFYESQELLADSVSRFLTDGVRAGQPLVVIAKKPLWKAVSHRLRATGIDPAYLIAEGRCVMLDSTAALGAFMQGRKPDAELFYATIGDVMRKVIDGRAYIVARAFGDMVDVLSGEGNVDGAIELEDLWNDLGAKYSFSLLCAYSSAYALRTTGTHDVKRICERHHHLVDVPRELPPA